MASQMVFCFDADELRRVLLDGAAQIKPQQRPELVTPFATAEFFCRDTDGGESRLREVAASDGEIAIDVAQDVRHLQAFSKAHALLPPEEQIPLR